MLKYEGYLFKIFHVSDTTRTVNWLGLPLFIWQSKHRHYRYLTQARVCVCVRTLYTDTHTHMKEKFWRQNFFSKRHCRLNRSNTLWLSNLHYLQ